MASVYVYRRLTGNLFLNVILGSMQVSARRPTCRSCARVAVPQSFIRESHFQVKVLQSNYPGRTYQDASRVLTIMHPGDTSTWWIECPWFRRRNFGFWKSVRRKWGGWGNFLWISRGSRIIHLQQGSIQLYCPTAVESATHKLRNADKIIIIWYISAGMSTQLQGGWLLWIPGCPFRTFRSRAGTSIAYLSVLRRRLGARSMRAEGRFPIKVVRITWTSFKQDLDVKFVPVV